MEMVVDGREIEMVMDGRDGDGNGWKKDKDGNGWERYRTKYLTVNLYTMYCFSKK